MDLFVPRRSNQPSDETPKKEVPNGVTTWDFNDLGARASCSCSRYHRAARKLFNISITLIRTLSHLIKRPFILKTYCMQDCICSVSKIIHCLTGNENNQWDLIVSEKMGTFSLL